MILGCQKREFLYLANFDFRFLGMKKNLSRKELLDFVKFRRTKREMLSDFDAKVLA